MVYFKYKSMIMLRLTATPMNDQPVTKEKFSDSIPYVGSFNEGMEIAEMHKLLDRHFNAFFVL